MGHTEVALSRKDRPSEALRETLTGNLEELQRLSALVTDMLFLSRADRGAMARCGAPSRLAALVRQAVDYHEAPLAEAQVRVYIEGDAETAVDEPLFKRAVSNLLGKATRYALPGSAITVHISLVSDQAEVFVENSGPDIDALHMPRLFDRFFRADMPRADGHMHHGLGLAIVAAIARMHAGQTHATSGEDALGLDLQSAAPNFGKLKRRDGSGNPGSDSPVSSPSRRACAQSACAVSRWTPACTSSQQPAEEP
jgi:two-component system heavy metal sensor histidine kinase CusS